MAAYYVWSGAGGLGTGLDWDNAYTSLVTALVAKLAGDVFYIAQDHSESAAGITITSPGTLAAPCYFYTVNRAGSVPPVSADLTTGSAFLSTTNTSITIAGTIGYWNGSTFTIGNSTGGPVLNLNNTTGHFELFKNCVFVGGSTGAAVFSMGTQGGTAAAGKLILEDCDFTFSATGQTILVSTDWEWRGSGSAISGTIPTTLINFTTNRAANVLLQGVDLSAAGAGKTLFDATDALVVNCLVMDCKLNAGVTISATPSGPGYPQINVVRSGATGINYNLNMIRYSGTMAVETTVVRTGGAQQPDSQAFAWAITTSANSELTIPFDAPPIPKWNSTDGSAVTVTVQGTWGGGAVPNNDDIWIEVEYLSDNSSPQGSRVSGGKANPLAVETALAAGSGTWGGGTTPFAMSATFTPQQAGLILVYVRAALPSTTFYVDPKVTIS